MDTLGIDLETVCTIAIKAREFDAKVEVTEPDPGSNAADDAVGAVLQDYPNDPTLEELTSLIDGLNEDEQVSLVAIAWLGRGDYGEADWEEVVAEARGARSDHTARYLTGIPLLADYLEEGLAKLDRSCDDYKMGRL